MKISIYVACSLALGLTIEAMERVVAHEKTATQKLYDAVKEGKATVEEVVKLLGLGADILGNVPRADPFKPFSTTQASLSMDPISNVNPPVPAKLFHCVVDKKNPPEVVRVVLRHVRDMIPAGELNEKYYHFLAYAFYRGYEDVVSLLTQYTYARWIPHESDYIQEIPLHWASKEGHTEIIKILLLQILSNCPQDVLTEMREYINQENSDLQTPLWMASCNGHKDIVTILLDNRANAEIVDCGEMSPLFMAVMKGFDEIVALLLARGAHDNTVDCKKMTLLHAAAESNNTTRIVETLLTRRANVFQKDEDGRTPLHCAVNSPMLRPELVKVLLERSSIMATNVELKKKYYSFLSYAYYRGYRDLVTQLLEHDPIARWAEDGTTSSLHRAAKEGDYELVLLFLNNGANARQTDYEGRTPLQLAATKGDALASFMEESEGPQSVTMEVLARIGQKQEVTGKRASDKFEETCKVLMTSSFIVPEAKPADIFSATTLPMNPLQSWNQPIMMPVILNHHAPGVILDRPTQPVALLPFFATPITCHRKTVCILGCLKRFNVPKDVCYLILSFNREEAFNALIPRINNGIARNCLAEYMRTIPVFLKHLVIERIYDYTINIVREDMKKAHSLMKHPVMLELLHAATLEELFAPILHNNIRERLFPRPPTDSK